MLRNRAEIIVGRDVLDAPLRFRYFRKNRKLGHETRYGLICENRYNLKQKLLNPTKGQKI